jgi:hypothetical protein
MNNLLKAVEHIVCPRGYTQFMSINPDTGEVSNLVAQPNTIMTDGGDCMARLLAGDFRYKLAYMYMEFENLSDPSDDPVVPSYTPADGVEYYNSLEVHPSQDFLRVPLLTSPSFSPSASGYAGNVVTFVALSGGFVAGNWGKPFSEASVSAVFGGALAAAPTGLQQGDMIFARNYPTGAKIIKPSGEQIVMQWSIEFGAGSVY